MGSTERETPTEMKEVVQFNLSPSQAEIVAGGMALTMTILMNVPRYYEDVEEDLVFRGPSALKLRLLISAITMQLSGAQTPLELLTIPSNILAANFRKNGAEISQLFIAHLTSEIKIERGG